MGALTTSTISSHEEFSAYPSPEEFLTNEDYVANRALFNSKIQEEKPLTLKTYSILKPLREVIEERMKALPFIKSNETFGDRSVTRLCLPHYLHT
jgi:hypothetical protein